MGAMPTPYQNSQLNRLKTALLSIMLIRRYKTQKNWLIKTNEQYKKIKQIGKFEVEGDKFLRNLWFLKL